MKEDGGYRVKKFIREMVVFATQNVIKDPPFTRLYLLSCRNLMIYLEPEVQNHINRQNQNSSISPLIGCTSIVCR